MKSATVALLGAISAVEAHYLFPALVYDGVTTTDWEYVRTTANHYSHGPVTDVTSGNMTCYQLASGNEGAAVYTVTAGSTLTFTVEPDIFHPGPLSIWIGQVPSGETALTWDGSGAHWTKIYQDQATFTTAAISWPNDGDTEVSVTIPSCLKDGDYFVRPEHIALHTAETVGGAQFYLSCGQITVTGGSGTWDPPSDNVVEIPGVYSATDPGILIDIWWPIPTNYTPPGPAAYTC